MGNKELVLLIFNKIKEFGYTIYDVQHVDGYFVFEGEQDSVTHFRVKGHGMWKHWKFGLWVHSEYLDPNYEKRDDNYKYSVIELFAQYDTQIDKFKPSRSALCVSYDVDEINSYLNKEDLDYNGNSYTFHELKSMLGMMCKHPLMCYDEYCGDINHYTETNFLFTFLKYEWKEKWHDIKQAVLTSFWLPYTKLKVALAGRSKIIDSIELYDFRKENPGWSTNYLYQVRFVFTEAATQEQECKWLNFWWHHERYGHYGFYQDVIELDSCRKVGHDGFYCYS